MGYSSYDCKHCNHPVLCAQAADEGINDWMTQAVVLGANGTRALFEFDGYSGSVDHVSLPYGETVWVHEACWEVAGMPEFETYDGPSSSAKDQGWWFDDGDHDMIDPRITDEAERTRLLAEGVERREQRRYNARARDVHDWFDRAERDYYKELHGDKMWKLRWTPRNDLLRDDQGEIVRDVRGYALDDETKWKIRDRLSPTNMIFQGTEEELNAHLSAEWARFRESDECAAYLAHQEARYAEQRAKQLEKLKVEGRYTTSYRPSKIPGDTVGEESYTGSPWRGSRSVYTVRDELSYGEVAVMEAPWEALGSKHFESHPKYTGNNSPEWEARVEEIRAAGRESKRLAEEEAQRLNDEWAAAGYPAPEKS